MKYTMSGCLGASQESEKDYKVIKRQSYSLKLAAMKLRQASLPFLELAWEPRAAHRIYSQLCIALEGTEQGSLFFSKTQGPFLYPQAASAMRVL